MTDIPEICIRPEDFDPARIVIHDAVKNEFTIGTSKVTTTTSEGRYLDDEGRECRLYFTAPPQQCFGTSYVHNITLPKEKKTPENAEGVQVCYPLTGLTTVKTPTPQEQATLDLFHGLWQAAVDKGVSEVDNEETTMPQIAISSFIAASRKKAWKNAVKYPFSHPNDPTTKKPNTDKPVRAYVKLVTSGKGETLRVKTKFYGPGDKATSPLRYLETRGVIEPVIAWEGLYYGPHGAEAPYGTSLKFKIVEANFTPKDDSSGMPRHRMIGKNTAPVEEDGDEEYPPRSRPQTSSGSDEDNEGGDEDFAAPGDDESNPMAALEKASKGKQPKAVAKAPVKKAVAQKPKTILKKTVAKPTATKAKAKAAPVKKAAPKKVVEPDPEEEQEEEIEEDEE